MAGYREFQTGEVLTAANVNDFLGKQSVMKFADAAARNTALGTAVGGANALREGMVAYLDDTDELLKYDGTAWASIGAAGIGSNVVQTVLTDTFTTTSTSFTAITGLSVTITPSSATSKVLVLFDVQMFVGNGRAQGVRLMRGTTAIGIGDASSSRPRSSAATAIGTITSVADRNQWSVSRAILDSPLTTGAVTYSVEFYTNAGTGYVNRSTEDSDGTLGPRSVSTITAIEVAA
jgi:hypothetical protein